MRKRPQRRKPPPSNSRLLDSDMLPLIDAAASHRLILFAGGGVSQNLGLPDFRTMIGHIAEELGVGSGSNDLADYPVIAEAYRVRHAQLGTLRSWMDTVWHPPGIDIRKSEVHNLIVDLEFPIIYTTNYDRWIERAFEARRMPFHKITSVADLTIKNEGATEIIKFHGDFDDDDSLVLTESSYFRRMMFDTPLDIRLRSDSLAQPLLFLGYSLHDLNTRYLLFRLEELWKSSPHADQRPKSYIVMTERNPAQEIVLRSRGVLPITIEGDEPGRATTAFLRDLLAEVKKARRTGTRRKN
ncbi:MAG TPA: SIR2 family protein [Terracidiphilus sp.]|jgi:hypothetical protein